MQKAGSQESRPLWGSDEWRADPNSASIGINESALQVLIRIPALATSGHNSNSFVLGLLQAVTGVDYSKRHAERLYLIATQSPSRHLRTRHRGVSGAPSAY